MQQNRSRLLIGVVMALIAFIGYCSKNQYNELTGEHQRVSMTTEQEISLGLQSAPQMAAQHGGEIQDPELSGIVKRVGQKVYQSSDAARSPYKFDFHLLADPNAINAFALPGGQVFITYALLAKLQNEDQLAGVLGHEIGHVIARHSAEHMAQQELAEGLKGATIMATYDPSNPSSVGSQQLAAMISNLVLMKYSREDELESDELGVKYMIQSGYNPEALMGVMEILEAASGGNRPSEFSSTHPSPENRIEKIKASIEKYKDLKAAK